MSHGLHESSAVEAPTAAQATPIRTHVCCFKIDIDALVRQRLASGLRGSQPIWTCIQSCAFESENSLGSPPKRACPNLGVRALRTIVAVSTEVCLGRVKRAEDPSPPEGTPKRQAFPISSAEFCAASFSAVRMVAHEMVVLPAHSFALVPLRRGDPCRSSSAPNQAMFQARARRERR